MIRIVDKLCSVQDVASQLPISSNLVERKMQFDSNIKCAIENKNKFIVVVGPCSADNHDSMMEYLVRLKTLSDVVSDKMLVVARIYTAKPRTDGNGYLGKVFGNYADCPIDVNNGIIDSRKLMLDCLELGLPIADELLYPAFLPYFEDLVSYYFVGARSSMDPMHRDYASSLDVAVGVKNSIDGDLVAVAKSVATISSAKTFVHGDNIVVTDGNKSAHIVLRGYHDGSNFIANCDSKSTKTAYQLTKQYSLANNMIMVDCSHANSGKVSCKQIDNALTVIDDKNIGGIILESYLYSGSDATGKYGVSVTDDCLSWSQTEQLIMQLHAKL